jgi:hypothetical protein
VFGVVRDSPHPGGHHRGAGVTLSNFLSGLLETDAIVLHCASPRGVAPVDEFPGAAGITPRGERYQPCGWTAPLARTVDLKTFQNQTATLPL